MTSPGRHAAPDGSFGKSAGSALFRGAGLVGLAVLLGLIIMYWSLDDADGALDVGTPADTGEVVDAGVDGETPGEEGAVGGESTDDTVPVPGEDETPTTTASVPDEPDEEDGGGKNPSEVLVIAANGVGTPGLAGALKDDLVTMNYKVDPANAPNSAVSKVYFRQGYRQNAREIVDNLGVPPGVLERLPDDGSVTIKNDDDGGRVAAAHIVIIIGADDLF